MSQLSLKTIRLGDSADESKNFLIKTPAVADGTLVIERGNGTDVMTVSADGTVTMPNLNPQIWQDVKASRSLGSANYVNSTPLPIQVSMSGSSTAALQFKGWVGGVGVAFSTTQNSTGSGCGLVFTVPVGASYGVTDLGAGSVTISNWLELR